MERSILRTGSRRRGFVRWIFGGILILLLIGIFVVPFVFFRGLARGPLGPSPYYHYGGPFFLFPFGFLFFVLIAFFVVRSLFWGWGWGWRGRGGYRGEQEPRPGRDKHTTVQNCSRQFIHHG